MPGSSTDDPRPGEVALSFDPAERAEAGVTFIGHVRSPWAKGTAPKNVGAARETGKDARIELLPDYAQGLRGLEVGQAIVMLYWMGRRRDLIVQNPAHTGGPRGVFSLRSPVRPNPVALATVKVTSLDLENGVIGIDATDAWDGTPVIDIKPWLERVDVPPGWQP